MYSTVKLFFFPSFFIYTKILFESFLQPSLLALALLRLEAEEQHDQQHVENIAEALQSLQQQLNVSKQYHFTGGLRVVAQSCLLALGLGLFALLEPRTIVMLLTGTRDSLLITNDAEEN